MASRLFWGPSQSFSIQVLSVVLRKCLGSHNLLPVDRVILTPCVVFLQEKFACEV